MCELEDFRSWEDYFWPGTEVLRNKLGLRDPVELEAAERALSYGRLVELRASGRVSGRFDLAHLQAIHGYIFQDVYEWAGRVRTFALVKGGTEFCRPEHLQSYAVEVFDRLSRGGLLRGLDAEAFAERAADLLADINALHPFREGNGRCQRAFIEALADVAGHPLVWPGDAGARNAAASVAAMGGDNSGLRKLIFDGLEIGGSTSAET